MENKKAVSSKMVFQSYYDYIDEKGLGKYYKYRLNPLIKWISNNYGEESLLEQKMFDEWCIRRPTETAKTCNNRINAVKELINFIHLKGLGTFNHPANIKRNDPTNEIALWTEEEMANFFKACDEFRSKAYCPISAYGQKLVSIIAPVFFRFLYSSGIRHMEARWLKCDNVDLTHGIVTLERTKGGDKRIIVLHDSMLELMRKYDQVISKEIPSRTSFFPNKNGGELYKNWVGYYFRKFWDKYNSNNKVVAYSLRHNYAIENINSWPHNGCIVTDRIVTLAKSMGHSNLSSTLYYYHLVPAFADIYEELMGQTINDIIPDYE